VESAGNGAMTPHATGRTAHVALVIESALQAKRNGATIVPRVVITDGAVQGLERCRPFLAENNPRAVQRAGQAIEQHFALLEANADIGIREQ